MRTPEKQTKKGGDWLGKMASLLQELQKTRPFDKYQREKCAKLCERAHSRISSMLIQSLFLQKDPKGMEARAFSLFSGIKAQSRPGHHFQVLLFYAAVFILMDFCTKNSSHF